MPPGEGSSSVPCENDAPHHLGTSCSDIEEVPAKADTSFITLFILSRRLSGYAQHLCRIRSGGTDLYSFSLIISAR